MKIKFLLTKYEWSRFFPTLKKRDVEKIDDPELSSFKKKHIKRNVSIDLFNEFKKELRNNKNISNDEVILLPNKIDLYEDLIDYLNSQEHEYLLNSIFARNNKKFYYHIIARIKNPYSYYETKGVNFSIARMVFLGTKPLLIQTIFENLEKEYKKAKTKESLAEVRFNFHKSLRQLDLLENAYMESIMWNLLQISDAPFEIIEDLVLKNKKLKNHD